MHNEADLTTDSISSNFVKFQPLTFLVYEQYLKLSKTKNIFPPLFPLEAPQRKTKVHDPFLWLEVTCGTKCCIMVPHTPLINAFITRTHRYYPTPNRTETHLPLSPLSTYFVYQARIPIEVLSLC